MSQFRGAPRSRSPRGHRLARTDSPTITAETLDDMAEPDVIAVNSSAPPEGGPATTDVDTGADSDDSVDDSAMLSVVTKLQSRVAAEHEMDLLTLRQIVIANLS